MNIRVEGPRAPGQVVEPNAPAAPAAPAGAKTEPQTATKELPAPTASKPSGPVLGKALDAPDRGLARAARKAERQADDPTSAKADTAFERLADELSTEYGPALALAQANEEMRLGKQFAPEKFADQQAAVLAAELLAHAKGTRRELTPEQAKVVARAVVDELVGKSDNGMLRMAVREQARRLGEPWSSATVRHCSDDALPTLGRLMVLAEGGVPMPKGLINDLVGQRGMTESKKLSGQAGDLLEIAPDRILLAAEAYGRLSPQERKTIDAAIERGAGPALALVFCSEGAGLASSDARIRAASCERLTQAADELSRAGDAKAGLALAHTGVLGLRGPERVTVEGGGTLELFVHPSLSEADVQLWRGELERQLGAYPPALRSAMLAPDNARTGNRLLRISRPPGQAMADPSGKLNEKALATNGSYRFVDDTLRLNVDTKVTDRGALVRHELAHRLSDSIGPKEERLSHRAFGVESAFRERLQKLYGAFLERTDAHKHRTDDDKPVTFEEQDHHAHAVHAVSAYAVAGDDVTGSKSPGQISGSEEYLAEAITYYLGSPEANAHFRAIDPELYDVIGHVLFLAAQGDTVGADAALHALDRGTPETRLQPAE